MTLERKKISLVHVAKQRVGLCDDNYRMALRRIGHVKSATELSEDGFRAMMEYFAALGFRSDWRKRNLGDRPGMASASQVAMIRGLWREYTGTEDELALGRWLERSYHVTALRFLDHAAASNAITGLKRMVARRSGTRPAA